LSFIDYILNNKSGDNPPANSKQSNNMTSNLYDELTLLIGNDYYRDGVISFSLYSIRSCIYIHDDTKSNQGIILTINKNGSLDWGIKSEKCRNEVLTHLRKIIEDAKTLPTREGEFCKTITKFNNGEYIPEKKPEAIPEKVIMINISDKLVAKNGSYDTFRIITDDKSLYYVGNLPLYNSLKINQTYNVTIDRSEEYITGILDE
jgi:hypothetical protein